MPVGWYGALVVGDVSLQKVKIRYNESSCIWKVAGIIELSRCQKMWKNAPQHPYGLPKGYLSQGKRYGLGEQKVWFCDMIGHVSADEKALDARKSVDSFACFSAF